MAICYNNNLILSVASGISSGIMSGVIVSRGFSVSDPPQEREYGQPEQPEQHLARRRMSRHARNTAPPKMMKVVSHNTLLRKEPSCLEYNKRHGVGEAGLVQNREPSPFHAAHLSAHCSDGGETGNTEKVEYQEHVVISSAPSDSGCPYDNACAESFFSLLKNERIYRAKPRTIQEAEALIDEYIRFYNHERLQLKTGCTPMELRSAYAA